MDFQRFRVIRRGFLKGVVGTLAAVAIGSGTSYAQSPQDHSPQLAQNAEDIKINEGAKPAKVYTSVPEALKARYGDEGEGLYDSLQKFYNNVGPKYGVPEISFDYEIIFVNTDLPNENDPQWIEEKREIYRSKDFLGEDGKLKPNKIVHFVKAEDTSDIRYDPATYNSKKLQQFDAGVAAKPVLELGDDDMIPVVFRLNQHMYAGGTGPGPLNALEAGQNLYNHVDRVVKRIGKQAEPTSISIPTPTTYVRASVPAPSSLKEAALLQGEWETLLQRRGIIQPSPVPAPNYSASAVSTPKPDQYTTKASEGPSFGKIIFEAAKEGVISGLRVGVPLAISLAGAYALSREIKRRPRRTKPIYTDTPQSVPATTNGYSFRLWLGRNSPEPSAMSKLQAKIERYKTLGQKLNDLSNAAKVRHDDELSYANAAVNNVPAFISKINPWKGINRDEIYRQLQELTINRQPAMAMVPALVEPTPQDLFRKEATSLSRFLRYRKVSGQYTGGWDASPLHQKIEEGLSFISDARKSIKSNDLEKAQTLLDRVRQDVVQVVEHDYSEFKSVKNRYRARATKLQRVLKWRASHMADAPDKKKESFGRLIAEGSNYIVHARNAITSGDFEQAEMLFSYVETLKDGMKRESRGYRMARRKVVAERITTETQSLRAIKNYELKYAGQFKARKAEKEAELERTKPPMATPSILEQAIQVVEESEAKSKMQKVERRRVVDEQYSFQNQLTNEADNIASRLRTLSPNGFSDEIRTHLDLLEKAALYIYQATPGEDRLREAQQIIRRAEVVGLQIERQLERDQQKAQAQASAAVDIKNKLIRGIDVRRRRIEKFAGDIVDLPQYTKGGIIYSYISPESFKVLARRGLATIAFLNHYLKMTGFIPDRTIRHLYRNNIAALMVELDEDVTSAKRLSKIPALNYVLMEANIPTSDLIDIDKGRPKLKGQVVQSFEKNILLAEIAGNNLRRELERLEMHLVLPNTRPSQDGSVSKSFELAGITA